MTNQDCTVEQRIRASMIEYFRQVGLSAIESFKAKRDHGDYMVILKTTSMMQEALANGTWTPERLKKWSGEPEPGYEFVQIHKIIEASNPMECFASPHAYIRGYKKWILSKTKSAGSGIQMEVTSATGATDITSQR